MRLPSLRVMSFLRCGVGWALDATAAAWAARRAARRAVRAARWYSARASLAIRSSICCSGRFPLTRSTSLGARLDGGGGVGSCCDGGGGGRPKCGGRCPLTRRVTRLGPRGPAG